MQLHLDNFIHSPPKVRIASGPLQPGKLNAGNNGRRRLSFAMTDPEIIRLP